MIAMSRALTLDKMNVFVCRSEQYLKDCLDIRVDASSGKVCIRDIEGKLRRGGNQSEPMNSEVCKTCRYSK